MEEMLAPLGIFLFPAIAGTALLLVGNHRRVRRESGVKWLFAAGAALIVVSAVTIVWYDVDRNTVRFEYTATLKPTGSGWVRVSLPAPVDLALVANLAASPGSASAVVNRTGNESSIDVTLTEETTLTASFAAYRYSGTAGLTRADSLYACSLHTSGCNARVSVLVRSGNVSAVHVTAQASWEKTCGGPLWELDALALPGEREYPAYFGAIVC
jgi:hypothetical protein